MRTWTAMRCCLAGSALLLLAACDTDGGMACPLHAMTTPGGGDIPTVPPFTSTPPLVRPYLRPLSARQAAGYDSLEWYATGHFTIGRSFVVVVQLTAATTVRGVRLARHGDTIEVAVLGVTDPRSTSCATPKRVETARVAWPPDMAPHGRMVHAPVGS